MKQTVSRTSRHEGDLIKGSRFIADIAPASDESVARQFLDRVRTEFPDASHHCSAWRIASPAIDRANDDGEPGGSAGRPILAQLTGRDLVDVAVVVTRWFGGTKLGVGGLVRAYGGAAGQAIAAAELHPWVLLTEIRIRHGFTHTAAVERVTRSLGAVFVERSFTTTVACQIRLPQEIVGEFTQRIADATNGEGEVITQTPKDD